MFVVMNTVGTPAGSSDVPSDVSMEGSSAGSKMTGSCTSGVSGSDGGVEEEPEGSPPHPDSMAARRTDIKSQDNFFSWDVSLLSAKYAFLAYT